MRAYIISGNHIAVCHKRPTAPQRGKIVITSAADLRSSKLSAKRLLAIRNGLPGSKKTTKVVDRSTMIERLWAALEALPGLAPEREAEKRHVAAAPAKPVRTSKQSQVIDLLRRPNGATIDEIAAVTGWQRHTVRGTIAGALKRKLALPVASAKEERGRVYRLPDEARA